MWPPAFSWPDRGATDDSAFPARPHIFGVDDGNDERHGARFREHHAAYIAFGIEPKHLLSAVIMTAPGTLVMAKMLVPRPKCPEPRVAW